MDKLIKLEELKNIFMGTILREQLEGKVNITKFASAIGYQPQTIYNWYKNKSLHVDDIVRASHFLNYNLLQYYIRQEKIILPPGMCIAIEVDLAMIDMSKLPDSIRHLIESKKQKLYVIVDVDAHNVDLSVLPDGCRLIADDEKWRLKGL